MGGGINPSVTGKGAVGELLAEPVKEELLKQEESEGCNIFSVEVEGSAAYVEFETAECAELVIAVYEEDGIGMLGSGSVNVCPGEKTASVDLEIETMPQYFYLRGFLIDPDSFRPLCKSYESPKYTKDMQDFLASKTGDYEAGRVLNFDEAEDTNFAVYAESTILLKTEDANVNQITAVDEERQIYQIANADDTALALSAGEVFSAAFADGTVLAVKVKEVSVDGTTVTVTGDGGLGIKEVFSYVKIEENLGMEEAKIDPSSCSEGVVYHGLVEEEQGPAARGIAPYADGSVTESKSMHYTFADIKLGGDDAGAALKGDADLRFDNTFEYYLTLSNTYISLKMDYNGTLKIDMEGHAKGSVTISGISFSALGILNISFTPKLLFDASAKLNITGTISGTVGFSCSVKEGMKNLTTSPSFQADLTAEAKLYVGIELKPAISLVSDHVAQASMTATVGGLVTGKLAMTTAAPSDTSVRHDCASCVDGDVFGKYSVSFLAKLLDQSWLTFTYNAVDQTVKVADFYYSIGRNEFGFTSCPHILYLMTVTVKNTDGAPVADALVNGSYTTNAAGQASFYLPDGNQTVTASKGGYATSKAVSVNESAQSIVVVLSGQESSSGNGGYDSTNAGEIKQVSLGGAHSAALMKDGNLYMWGSNADGRIGFGSNSSLPKKMHDDNVEALFPENSVEKVVLGYSNSAVITKDGSLYMWGNNEYGKLGDGTTTNRNRPVKILDDVSEVVLGRWHSAAITKDGSLYMWGLDEGAFEVNTETFKKEPVKVLEHVSQVALSDIFYYNNITTRHGKHCVSAAVTEDGSLYTWGSNYSGWLGAEVGSGTPMKILENVSEMKLGNKFGAAITKDRSLYLWGAVSKGGGSGYEPLKVLSNVSEFAIGSVGSFSHYKYDRHHESRSYCAAITDDGSLYMWGDNSCGKLGDGTTASKSLPVKIAQNIAHVVLHGDNSAAITRDGSLYMWGDNRYGQLGDGTTENRNRPVKIMDNVAEVKVSSIRGDDPVNNCFTAAIKKDGRLYTWGYNASGQLGDGTTENKLVPTQIQIDTADDTPVLHTLAAEYAAADGTSYHPISTYAESDTATGAKTVTYTDLKPDADYLFYSMKYKGDSHPLGAANLLYVAQVKTDENGSFTLNYAPDEEYATPTDFVVAMEQTDIGEADVTIPTLSYSGLDQYINPLFIYNEQRLTEGADYRLTGAYLANEVGEYSFTVTGMGAFKGKRTVTYTMEQKDLKTLDVSPLDPVAFHGEAVTPKLTVKNGEVILQEGKDYTVSFQNNKGAGLGIAIIDGCGNYSGRQIFLFDISPCELSEEMLSAIPDQTYTGEPLTPDIALGNLSAGTDYRVEYFSNTEIGTAEVLITGIGSYTGSLRTQFQIIPKKPDESGDKEPEEEKKDCRMLEIAEIEPLTYTGAPLMPEPVVKDGKTLLEKGKDYTVSYQNNTNAGIGIAVINGAGGYTGRQVCLFAIAPRSLEKTMLSAVLDQEYTGKPVCPQVLLENLVPGRDYKVSYANNTEIGTAEATVMGTGNYTGTLTAEFTILPKKSDTSAKEPEEEKKDCRMLEIAEIEPLTYTGAPLTPEPVVKDGKTLLEKGKDYTVSYQNNTNAGIGIAVINGAGSYTGRQVCLFAIAPRSLEKTMLSAVLDQEYTGKPVCPQVLLENLVLGRDYGVSYANNTEIGTAEATVTGTGNYTGTLTVEFAILPKKDTPHGGNKEPGDTKKPESSTGQNIAAKPKKVKISSLKASGSRKLAVKWKKISDANGYEIWCAPKKSFKSGVKKQTIKKGTKTSAIIKRLSFGKQYYVRVRAYKTVKRIGFPVLFALGKQNRMWPDSMTMKPED